MGYRLPFIFPTIAGKVWALACGRGKRRTYVGVEQLGTVEEVFRCVPGRPQRWELTARFAGAFVEHKVDKRSGLTLRRAGTARWGVGGKQGDLVAACWRQCR